MSDNDVFGFDDIPEPDDSDLEDISYDDFVWDDDYPYGPIESEFDTWEEYLGWR